MEEATVHMSFEIISGEVLSLLFQVLGDGEYSYLKVEPSKDIDKELYKTRVLKESEDLAIEFLRDKFDDEWLGEDYYLDGREGLIDFLVNNSDKVRDELRKIKV